MKKRLIALIIAGAMILTMIPAMLAFADESAGEAPDYSREECWYKIPEITKDVDTFYIYSTMYSGSNEDDPDYARLDNAEVLENIGIEHAIKSSVFEDSTNLFIPYYRQCSMAFAARTLEETGSFDEAMSGTNYDDITAALDYYFENYNGGRPFVIAGHSQGSAILRFVLKDYFKEHPEYYERMVAAYAIGYSVTKDYLESNPHLKFATGESDTGVIISWNAEGPKNVEEDAMNALLEPNAISINPLNWKLDETYAPASENLGSIVMDKETGETEIRDIGGDAQVNIARGTVITNADAVPNEMHELTGPQSYHQDDYSIFYNNIKDNVAKRVTAYTSRNTKTFHLATSFYTLEIPQSYMNGELSEEDIEDSMAAHMYSPESELAFDVYQFDKIGLPDTLAKLPGELFNATDIKTDLNINGIHVACGKSVEPYEGEDCDTITYFMDNGDSYVEVVFWLGDEASEAQAEEIISTLGYTADAYENLDFATAGNDSAYSLEDIIRSINESGYDIIGLFNQIADLVEIFINDGETETVGNIIRAVGHLVNTVITGDDASPASSELVRDLILDEDSLSQMSSGTVLDIYEACRDELAQRGIVVVE